MILQGTTINYFYETARRQPENSGEEFIDNGIQNRFKEFDQGSIVIQYR